MTNRLSWLVGLLWLVGATASCATTSSACQGAHGQDPPQTGLPCAEPEQRPKPAQDPPQPGPGNPMPAR